MPGWAFGLFMCEGVSIKIEVVLCLLSATGTASDGKEVGSLATVAIVAKRTGESAVGRAPEKDAGAHAPGKGVEERKSGGGEERGSVGSGEEPLSDRCRRLQKAAVESGVGTAASARGEAGAGTGRGTGRGGRERREVKRAPAWMA